MRVRSSNNSRARAQLVKRLPTQTNATGLVQSSNPSITYRNKTSQQRRAKTALEPRTYDGMESRHGSLLFHTIYHRSTSCTTDLGNCPRGQLETTRPTRATKNVLDSGNGQKLRKSLRQCLMTILISFYVDHPGCIEVLT